MYAVSSLAHNFKCRTPHGVRELKSFLYNLPIYFSCRTPHGVRELKFEPEGVRFNERSCRTPHGVRELKYYGEGANFPETVSHPAWGA